MVVPYTLELNDTYIYHVGMHGADEQYNRMRDMVAGLEPELKAAPRVLTLSFHNYLMGQAHRAHYAARTLDHLLARPDTKFMSGAQILRLVHRDGNRGQGKGLPPHHFLMRI